MSHRKTKADCVRYRQVDGFIEQTDSSGLPAGSGALSRHHVTLDKTYGDRGAG